MSDDSINIPAGLTVQALLGRRYLARLIDTVIISILVGMGVFAAAAAFPGTVGSISGILLSITVSLAIWVTYGSLLESSPWQATVGKKVLGLRV